MKSYCVTLNREKILPHMEKILAENAIANFCIRRDILVKMDLLK